VGLESTFLEINPDSVIMQTVSSEDGSALERGQSECRPVDFLAVSPGQNPKGCSVRADGICSVEQLHRDHAISAVDILVGTGGIAWCLGS
jgi:hypothetical protein